MKQIVKLYNRYNRVEPCSFIDFVQRGICHTCIPIPYTQANTLCMCVCYPCQVDNSVNLLPSADGGDSVLDESGIVDLETCLNSTYRVRSHCTTRRYIN